MVIPSLDAATGRVFRKINRAHVPERRQLASYRADAESAILETIARWSCTLEDLTRILGLHANEVNKYLDVLAADKKIEVVQQKRGFFYRLKQAE